MSTHSQDVLMESWLVAAGRSIEAGSPLNIPIIPASNFLRGSDHVYSRGDGTPAWEALEEILGGLEDAQAVVFASGMAAVAAVFDQLPVGSHVVLPEDCYMGVASLATLGSGRARWTLERLSSEDTQGWIQACARADLIWLESPTNPLLSVADLQAICTARRKSGAIVAVDNTFATPLNQRPLDFGATVSVQSATKYIGGHSDLLSGVVTTRDESMRQALLKSREANGATPGALETYLAIRGIRTMALRIERAQQSAAVLAERLASHPLVSVARYPGLTSHPTYGIARRVLKGFGSIISFDLRGGATEADAVCSNVKLIRHATSLGSVESTMERRSGVNGQAHLPPSLIRLSVGIEHVDDLWKDLEQAIARAMN